MPEFDELASSQSIPKDAQLETHDFATDGLRIKRVVARESLSSLYELNVLVVAQPRAGDAAPLDPDAVVGTEVSLVFLDDGGVALRRFSGIVSEIRERADDVAVVHATYELTVVPRAFGLALVTTQEIFQDMTVPEIIVAKLAQVGLTDAYDLRLSDAYPKRDFVVQYKETSLAFISRLAEDVGITFHFEQTEHGERIVLTDSNDMFPLFGARRDAARDSRRRGVPVPYLPRAENKGVFELATRARIISSLYAVHDFNEMQPGLDLGKSKELEGEYAGGVIEYGTHHQTPDEGARVALVRAEEAMSRRRVYEGKGVVAFSPGLRFELDGHPFVPHKQLLVTKVQHRLEISLGNDEAVTAGYEATFEAVPAERRFRPPRVTPKPRIHGVVPGFIQVRPSAHEGDLPELDAHGRYLVHLDFDTADASEQKASCRIRMAQPFAGPGQNMHFPLRPGTEVAVAFVDGDPDRPLIVGAVPNAVTQSLVTSSDPHMHRIKAHHGIVVEFGTTVKSS